MKKKTTLAKLRAANKRIKALEADVKEQRANYEHLWQMRIQDERERRQSVLSDEGLRIYGAKK